MSYFSDYPTEPIGGTNPYYRCVYCKRSDPEINGQIEKHALTCEYRINKDKELRGEVALTTSRRQRIDEAEDIFGELLSAWDEMSSYLKYNQSAKAYAGLWRDVAYVAERLAREAREIADETYKELPS